MRSKRQADRHLREFWQRLAAVVPVNEQSGDARKQGRALGKAGREGEADERGGRDRSSKEESGEGCSPGGPPAASPQPG